MPSALRKILQSHPQRYEVVHAATDSARRAEIEDFIRIVFAEKYGAFIPSFAPDLMMVKRAGSVAACGWRGAGGETLYLERYLDAPVDAVLGAAAGHAVAREIIVEVGNLAANRPGATMDLIASMGRRLHRLGYEWVVFTATRDVIGLFRRLGLPPLALGAADPDRLGANAATWGNYYDTEPVVVATRIRVGLQGANANA